MSQLRLEVAAALLEIRDKKLFRGRYKNFEEFCDAELNIQKAYAYELAKAGEIQRDLQSAMADSSKLPRNERQSRPLAKLKTPEERLGAWQRALEIAGDKAVTEADVRKAIKELHPSTKLQLFPTSDRKYASDWRVSLVTKLTAHGYEGVFEQPFKWPSDLANLHSGERQRYLKFVDTLNFSESAAALALKQHSASSLIIINADANAPDGVLFSKGDAPSIEKESFPPTFHFMAKQLNAIIEHEGTLYRAGELDDASETEWR